MLQKSRGPSDCARHAVPARVLVKHAASAVPQAILTFEHDAARTQLERLDRRARAGVEAVRLSQSMRRLPNAAAAAVSRRTRVRRGPQAPASHARRRTTATSAAAGTSRHCETTPEGPSSSRGGTTTSRFSACWLTAAAGVVRRRRVDAARCSRVARSTWLSAGVVPGPRLQPSISITSAAPVSPAAQPVNRPRPPPRSCSAQISSIRPRAPVGACG
jgi:hypothetical protein